MSYIDNFKLDPWWITGFWDGEGCFHISITKNKKWKVGYKVELIFSICLHEKDKALLEQIKNFFNLGSITKQRSRSI